MIVCEIDTALNDLRASGLPIDPAIIELLELARDDVAELRASLDAARVAPAPASLAQASGIELGDELRDAWRLAADFRQALRAGDARSIADLREELLDQMQVAEHVQVRAFYGEVLNTGRRKSLISIATNVDI